MPVNEYQTALRRRIEYEDGLLNTRTTIFIATNGLLLAAIGLGATGVLSYAISGLGLFVSVMWFLCGRRSLNILRKLTKEYLGQGRSDVEDGDTLAKIEKIVQDALGSHGWRRPTALIARGLPIVFLAGWMVIVAVLAWRAGAPYQR